MRATTNYLGSRGISISTTPAQFHEKRIERHIQTLKAKKRSIEASLSFILPEELEAEAYLSTIHWWNRMPNRNTIGSTPHQLVIGEKFSCPQYAFGDVGLFYSKKADTASVWGIFIGYGQVRRYLRAYVPGSGMYSKYHFKPQQFIPAEWKFRPRLATGRAPSNVISTQPLISLNPNVQTQLFDRSTDVNEDILSPLKSGSYTVYLNVATS